MGYLYIINCRVGLKEIYDYMRRYKEKDILQNLTD